MSVARSLPRVVRHAWRARRRLKTEQQGWMSELATSIDSLLDAHPIGRAALRAYRLLMRAMLAAAILLVLAGAALALGLRDSSPALVLGVVVAVVGLLLGWQWWMWSAGLRFLREHVDESRRVPASELPARFASLARDAGGLGRLADDLRDLARSLGGDGRRGHG